MGNEIAKVMEIMDATEGITDVKDHVRLDCEKVAEALYVAEIDHEADKVEPQVAEQGMEVV